MANPNFLKIDKDDPAWRFTPQMYFEKKFKMVDIKSIVIEKEKKSSMVLRQHPLEKELLAKKIKIDLEESSSLELIIFNEVNDYHQQIYLYDITLNYGSVLTLSLFAKNGKFNKHIVNVNMDENSEFTSYGIIMNTVGGDTEYISKIIQQTPGSVCQQTFAGIAGTNSQTVFQGLNLLDKDGNYTQNTIENFNLVTGENGRCYSKPDIYIDNDNVNTSHVSQIETLSDDLIYYLESRGIAPETAKSLIISGFQDKIINILPYSDLQEELRLSYSNT